MLTFADGSGQEGERQYRWSLPPLTSRVKPLPSVSMGSWRPGLPCRPTPASTLVTQSKSPQVLTVTYRTWHDASPSLAAQAKPSAQMFCSPYPCSLVLNVATVSPGDIWQYLETFVVVTTGVYGDGGVLLVLSR